MELISNRKKIACDLLRLVWLEQMMLLSHHPRPPGRIWAWKTSTVEMKQCLMQMLMMLRMAEKKLMIVLALQQLGH
jgi:hypothetical protein